MRARVVIVDYGIGNVFSVANALKAIGADVSLTRSFSEIRNADRLILPGVGAFARAMDALRELGLETVIRDYVATGRPFLGICIGMQVLMQRSTEFGAHEGLGFIEGSVERIQSQNPEGRHIRVPHIGWSPLRAEQPWDGTPLASSGDGSVYFVHSFHCLPVDRQRVLATVDYDGISVTAAIRKDNIVGVQFHPERSGVVGQRILAAFVRDDAELRLSA
jgi:glutamine amidotransferase